MFTISSGKDIVSVFMPHALGHFVGLDTHDLFQVDDDQVFEPNMVFACEPGLYFNKLSLSSAFKDTFYR